MITSNERFVLQFTTRPPPFTAPDFILPAASPSRHPICRHLDSQPCLYPCTPQFFPLKLSPTVQSPHLTLISSQLRCALFKISRSIRTIPTRQFSLATLSLLHLPACPQNSAASTPSCTQPVRRRSVSGAPHLFLSASISPDPNPSPTNPQFFTTLFQNHPHIFPILHHIFLSFYPCHSSPLPIPLYLLLSCLPPAYFNQPTLPEFVSFHPTNRPPFFPTFSFVSLLFSTFTFTFVLSAEFLLLFSSDCVRLCLSVCRAFCQSICLCPPPLLYSFGKEILLKMSNMFKTDRFCYFHFHDFSKIFQQPISNAYKC